MGRRMKKWPLWIGTTLLAVAGLQLAMIFVLPSLPIGVASDSAKASNDPASGDISTAAPASLAEPAEAAALPRYTACVHEASKQPLHVASAATQLDILFVFSATADPRSEHIAMHAPTQFNVVMFRRVTPHDPAAEGNDGAVASADCTPF